MKWLELLLRPPKPLTAQQRAHNLIRAIDAGGLPLSASIVNNLARQLGLEVSTHAPMEETIARIRAVLSRT